MAKGSNTTRSGSSATTRSAANVSGGGMSPDRKVVAAMNEWSRINPNRNPTQVEINAMAGNVSGTDWAKREVRFSNGLRLSTMYGNSEGQSKVNLMTQIGNADSTRVFASYNFNSRSKSSKLDAFRHINEAERILRTASTSDPDLIAGLEKAGWKIKR